MGFSLLDRSWCGGGIMCLSNVAQVQHASSVCMAFSFFSFFGRRGNLEEERGVFS